MTYSFKQFGSQTRGLFEWPRTNDENIYESPCTLWPVGARRHIGDTDKRPKQIEWIEVCPYVAALNCMLHKRVNRTGDLSARSFIHLRGTSDDGVQCRCDDLFRFDVLHEEQHPGSQCLNGRQFPGELAFCRGQLFHFSVVDGFEKGIARPKVTVQGSTCTVSWCTLRKRNGSRVVSEHHYDHQQIGGPLTSEDLSLNAATSAVGFRKPS